MLVGLLHRDVGHEPGWGGAVPVVFAGLEEDAVAGTDDLDRRAFALAEANAVGDPDCLAARVGVPGGAGAGGEVDGRGADPPVVGWRGDRVDVDVAGEPVVWAATGVEAVPRDLDALSPQSVSRVSAVIGSSSVAAQLASRFSDSCDLEAGSAV